MAGIEPREHCTALGEKAKQTAHRHIAWKQQSEDHLGHTMGRLFTHLGACPRGTAFMERDLWEQKNCPVPFPSLSPQHKCRATCRNQYRTDTHYLLTSSTTCWWNHTSQSHLPQCQPRGDPSPECLSPYSHSLPAWEFYRASVWAAVVTILIS